MLHWILILTLVARQGAAVTQVPGFLDEAACQHAAQTWKAALPSIMGKESSSVCVLDGTPVDHR